MSDLASTYASILAIFFPLTQIKPLVTGAKFLGDWGVLCAKTMVLKRSLCQARRVSYSKVIVDGDSLLVIKCLSNAFESISFNHVFRKAIFVANSLANLGHSLTSDCGGSQVC
ncbi:hypothetical protein DVH24_039371 [Malus domestica]|uniref:RNase H type-1 domain-containing protein n=1 Tax=Malus domestica TaxID=3750 RepID=A0A498I0A8_MALDO|nr:hypothetical protein DVH24_039371 [Malus domestica]